MRLTVGKHVVSTSLRNDLEIILIFLQEESAKELMVMVTAMATALSGPSLLHMAFASSSQPEQIKTEMM